MDLVRQSCKWVMAISLLSAVAPSAAFAQHYNRTDLVSSIPAEGTNALNGHDTQLVNSWGLTRSAGSAFWISDNGTGLATVYNGIGNKTLTVTIPAPSGVHQHSSPTGVVANGTSDFALPGSTAAKFIFVTEEGTIAAWNGGAAAVIVKDNSSKLAVYKGCTIAEWNGKHFLYVANFQSGEIEVYDSTFHPVNLDRDAFRMNQDQNDRENDNTRMGNDDDRDYRGFAPFNVQAIGTNLYVTYAKQDATRKDEVDGAGLGFVNIFTPGGSLQAHLQNGPWFNAPWGVAQAPGEFGEFSHSLLVGMFGSGQIAAFNPVNGRFIALMKKSANSTLTIDGLWALVFGAGNANSGAFNTLFFTAGPNHENDGTFGTLVPVTAELNEIDEP
jgi:uncharacterized protein (TIGR03118 family)